MSTLALPIRELEQHVQLAYIDTERVASRSRQQESVDFRLVGQIITKTFQLKFKFADLARREQRLINGLIDRDFSELSTNDLTDLAARLDGIVEGQREILEDISELGSITRFWWGKSVLKLAEQADHMESISASLRMSADSDCEALLALAVEQIA